MSWRTRLGGFLDRFLPLAVAGDERLLLRGRLTVLLAFGAVAVTLTNMLVRWLADTWTPAEFVVLSVCVAAWLATPPLLKRSRGVDGAAALLLGSALLSILFISWQQGGLRSAVVPWLALVPMVAAVLFSGRLSAVMGVIVTGTIWGYYALSLVPGSLPIYWSGDGQAELQVALNLTALTVIGTLAAWGYAWYRERGSDELRQAERALSAVADASEVGLVVVAAGEIQLHNPAAEEPLAWEREHGRPLRDLLCGGEGESDLRLVDADGVARSLAVRTSSIRMGGRDGTLFSLVDQTAQVREAEERMALQRRLQEDQRLESLGLLAGGVAHDFNNLLAPILGNLAFLIDSANLDADQRAALEDIRRASTQAAELVRQILGYAGKDAILKQPIDLSELVSSVCRLVQKGLHVEAEIVVEPGFDLPPALGDPGLLKQVLANVVSNALLAATVRVIVHAGCREVGAADLSRSCQSEPLAPGRYLFVRVCDDGAGIPEHLRERIFEPFFTTRVNGRGLGLASSLGIVRRLRGDLLLDTEPGRTEFEILLPPGEKQPAAPPRFQPRRPLGTGTVLVADDEPLVRSQLQRLLNELGWTVHVAEDGPSALAILEEHGDAIDGALVDYIMPGMSGAELLLRMRRHRPTLRVVLCTGFTPKDSELAAFDHVVRKPFTVEELRDALRVLQHH